ncbi:hypothetical protein D9611_009595 [Ephemerocybe angulata]|uniref:Uncharacterized protein n=1 Tax=Ephemerocybe angulata TaxID=980116 RepID=A0A8H5C6P0_9AGAR|nr:hypothetical protein D9611_009595 [Tulosesus angulatus]
MTSQPSPSQAARRTVALLLLLTPTLTLTIVALTAPPLQVISRDATTGVAHLKTWGHRHAFGLGFAAVRVSTSTLTRADALDRRPAPGYAGLGAPWCDVGPSRRGTRSLSKDRLSAAASITLKRKLSPILESIAPH